MTSLKLQDECLTCTQLVGPGSLSIQIDKNSTMPDVLRKHFWFTEVDIQQASLCQICYDHVICFHKFYVSAEELYHTRLASLIVKSEPVTNEDDRPDENLLGMLDCKLEPQNLAPVKEEPVDGIADEDESELGKSGDKDDDEPDDSMEEPPPVPAAKKRASGVSKINQDDYIREHVKYICEQCGRQSKSFELFAKHARDKHDNKSAAVSCCGRNYNCRSKLYDHVRVINNPDKFRCERCQKMFNNSWRYANHMNEHTVEGERLFKCEQCSKTFAVQSVYNKHLKNHRIRDRAKRFPCPDCTKSYRREGLLKDHIAAVHLGIKQYQCSFCPSTFSSQPNWYRHEKNIHPVEWRKLQKNSGVS